MDFKKLALEYKEDALKTLTDLVAFKSVLDEFKEDSDAPFGIENKRALEYMLNLGKNDGFIAYNDQNYAGHLECGKGKDLIGVLAHLDVVPVKDQVWASDPFTARINDNKFYARGALDDKGPLVAAYYALKLLKDQNIKLNKRVRLIMGCDEETGSRCLTHYFKTAEMPTLGFSPDAEFPVIYGEKAMASMDLYLKETDNVILDFICGTRYNIVPAVAKMKLSINLEKEYLEYLKENNYEGSIEDGYLVAKGLSAHAMCPQNGVNAAFILMEFLNKHHKTNVSEYFVKYLTNDPFAKKLGIDLYDEDMKHLTENVGLVNYVDGFIKVGLNYRIPRDNYHNEIINKFNETITKNDKVVLLSSSTMHYVSKDSFLVKTLMESYRLITNDYENEPFTIGGGTYAKFIDNCVAFGPQMPGMPDICHIADEYIDIDNFVNSIAVYAKAIYDLGK